MRPTVSVITHQRCRENLGNFVWIGGLDLEHARRSSLCAHLVELADDVFHRAEFVGVTDQYQAVAAGVGSNERVGRLGTEARFRLFRVESAHCAGELDGAGGREIEDARLAMFRSGLRGADLLQDHFDLLHVLGLSGDDKPAGTRVGFDLGIRGIGLLAILPLGLVQLLHQRLDPLDVRCRSDLEGACLTGRSHLLFECFNDLLDGGRLLLGSLHEKPRARGIGIHRGGPKSLSAGLFGVDLSDLGQHLGRSGIL